ncbi:hypothetical protein A2W70_03280 [Candidatus Curtissbacteria bacterium RIFCSPLOWO2_02_41_11]|uniref:Uncharacterized protein n=1 Tax=Candidatus Curtissbacteria bacterium RIFCSPLOWO2_02_41_11 TaxID=1797731 RepID=A0A1F5HTB5_9BACT|nr:MAG: hypothetical protein A2W70_03280 [Candidatus Curtissbacteria bacterium RIFCSPLOWO2_02_41_11]
MVNRRIENTLCQQQAAQRRIALMVWGQSRRRLEEGTGLTLRPLAEIQGTRAWAEAGKGKEREGA